MFLIYERHNACMEGRTDGLINLIFIAFLYFRKFAYGMIHLVGRLLDQYFPPSLVF